MATIEEQAPQTALARGALTLFDTISSTLANLAPVEGIFLAITLVVFAMGSMTPWAFLIAGAAILATGNTMSEFSRSIPSAGSFVTFIGRGIGARAPRTGQVLAGVSYYMLMICYPVTVGAVVVFMGSWVSSLAGWGNVGWLLVTLGGEATPFFNLSRHFSPWFDWFIGLVGFTSSFGCFIAAANSQTRITFNGARAGLRRAATAGPEYITQDAR
jgi:amino acid transporter